MTPEIRCAHAELKAPADLQEHPRNPFTHGKKQVADLARGIEIWGWCMPIIVSKRSGFIVSGHARKAAANLRGWTQVPVDYVDFASEALEIAFIKFANDIDEGRGTDKEKALELSTYLARLDNELNINLAGLAKFRLETSVLHEDVPADGGDPIEERASPGDLWTLGNHLLLVGDATDKDQVDYLLRAARADGSAPPVLMVTDPPYGVEYNPEWREGADLGVGNRAKGKVANDDRVDWSDAYRLFPGQVAYVWHAGRFTAEVATSLQAVDFEIVSQIIWAKQHFALSRGDYHWQHEPRWYAVRRGAKHNWQVARDQSTVWAIQNNNAFGGQGEEKFGHGTQKPIECMARPIANSTAKGEAVYDPFCGSGTTLIACEKLGRRGIALEIEPRYADQIIHRWEKVSGGRAKKAR